VRKKEWEGSESRPILEHDDIQLKWPVEAGMVATEQPPPGPSERQGKGEAGGGLWWGGGRQGGQWAG